MERAWRLGETLYDRWCRRTCQGLLREVDSDHPRERLLQEIWYHQRLSSTWVTTTEGRSVRLLHPGFWNRESGPDFHDAVLQFEGEPPKTGDVEIDLETRGWDDHGHRRNPQFRRVILHVVWAPSPSSSPSLPTLSLQQWLEAPLEELEEWLASENAPPIPSMMLGQCNGPLQQLTSDQQIPILEQAAYTRLQAKAARIRGRARRVGWHQAAWEGLFTALGYKHNTWPMRRLAEQLPRLRNEYRGLNSSPLAWQARLLGLGGLLPNCLPTEQNERDGLLRRLWDQWWRERHVLQPWILPRTLWRFDGLRPANHPERRLALAAHWLAEGELINRLEDWIHTPLSQRDLHGSLLRLLQGPEDPYWSWHWTLKSTCQAHSMPLLGPQRATDIAVNVLLPWFWARADAGRRQDVRDRVEKRYFGWPAAEENALLRNAYMRLMGSQRCTVPKTAARQQGLLQILRDFCEHSNALCDECHFPSMVEQFVNQSRADAQR